MDAAQIFVVLVTVACFYCTGASWMLQIVCYPTYLLVGEKEFVPFHVSFGRRLLVAVVPMFLTCLATFALLFVRPASVPAWAVIVTAICGAVILITTVALEVPKHLKLDREGKSDALINGLVRDNLPRTAAWTVASVLLTYMVVTMLQA
jgi:hypothetical protein